jgi:hypothetical protein
MQAASSEIRPRGGACRAVAVARGRGSRCSAGAAGEHGRAIGVDLVELDGKISEEGEERREGDMWVPRASC